MIFINKLTKSIKMLKIELFDIFWTDKSKCIHQFKKLF